VLRLAGFLRNPFGFLFAKSSAEEQVVSYLLREHARGRRVEEILQDRYVLNRLSPQQQARLLDRADVIRGLSDHDLAAAREYISTMRG
jgi:hypothetical protein